MDFDYCIIDEASQVLLTTCLGPLFSAKKFILVGDLEQLPPIVKNSHSRELGMNVSLFEWLDCQKASVELVRQYRMNSEIMDLANVITYCGKLKCVSDKTANSIINMDREFLSSVTSTNVKKIFDSSVIFIDTTELELMANHLKVAGEEAKADSSNSQLVENTIECQIISDLCEMFYKYSECNVPDNYGIIAPYNLQVNAILAKFATRKFFKEIEVSTVDQFQGRDKRVIMMSFTNTKMTGEIKVNY